MTAVFGEPKFLLKGEATFCAPNEHWFDVLDAERHVMCRVPMTKDQAEQFLKLNRCTVISAADFLQKWISKRDEK